MSKESFEVGIALGGGAFRGLAHIGVLQALNENGVYPQIVAGTSMGALIGGIYSCGMDLRLLERFCATINEKDLIDVTVPTDGLIAGSRIEVLLRTLTGNRTFDQLKVKFAAVATDLVKGERAVLTEGLLYQAIRASISIPAVFKPYVLGGRTYVDGGVVDRVPIAAARELGADYVLGVDVGYHGGEVPCEGIVSVILHSLEVMEWQIMQYTVNTADFNLVPQLMHINPASIAQSQECIRIGRETALEHMQEILSGIEEAKDRWQRES